MNPVKERTICAKCGHWIVVDPDTHLWHAEEAAKATRLKAAWEVRAGLIPGQPMPEYTKCFVYTSANYEEDGRHAEEFAYQPIFMKRLAEASSYHEQMSNPKVLNWAELTFLWY
jgi:hypothetical protein